MASQKYHSKFPPNREMLFFTKSSPPKTKKCLKEKPWNTAQLDSSMPTKESLKSQSKYRPIAERKETEKKAQTCTNTNKQIVDEPPIVTNQTQVHDMELDALLQSDQT